MRPVKILGCWKMTVYFIHMKASHLTFNKKLWIQFCSQSAKHSQSMLTKMCTYILLTGFSFRYIIYAHLLSYTFFHHSKKLQLTKSKCSFQANKKCILPYVTLFPTYTIWIFFKQMRLLVQVMLYNTLYTIEIYPFRYCINYEWVSSKLPIDNGKGGCKILEKG